MRISLSLCSEHTACPAPSPSPLPILPSGLLLTLSTGTSTGHASWWVGTSSSLPMGPTGRSCHQPGQSPMPLQAQVKSDHLPVPIIAVGEAFPSYKCRKTEFPFQKLHKIMKINTYFFFFCHTEDFSNSVLYQAMDSIVGQGGSRTWQLTARAEKKSVQVKICFLSEVHQDLPS